jgi:L,D-peptidoglycan transpeptidase YkuD (ErfK/YbiS/YcfS/YnhG family)
LYDQIIFIEHNFPLVQPDKGSCIFLHRWRKEGSATEGCTAMDSKNLSDLISWLDPSKNPVLIQLPQETYKKLKKNWNLPE